MAGAAPPLRVLQLLDFLRPGVGVPETLRLMVEPCRARGVELVVAALHREPGDLGDALAAAGVTLVDLDFRRLRGARRAVALWRALRRERIAVVHANEFRAIELALKVDRVPPRTPILGHLRVTGNVRSTSGARERWLARHAPRLRELVAVSQAVLDDFRAATGLAQCGRVIWNGRPLERFARRHPATRARYCAARSPEPTPGCRSCSARRRSSRRRITGRCSPPRRRFSAAAHGSSCCSPATAPIARR